MNVRPAETCDLQTIEALHRRMGFDYKLPKLDGKPGLITQIAEDETGIVGAVHIRAEAEAYLWLDLTAPVRARWDAIQALDADSSRILRSLGLRNVVAWIPKTIEEEFAHALVKLGFRRARSEFSAWGRDL